MSTNKSWKQPLHLFRGTWLSRQPMRPFFMASRKHQQRQNKRFDLIWFDSLLLWRGTRVTTHDAAAAACCGYRLISFCCFVRFYIYYTISSLLYTGGAQAIQLSAWPLLEGECGRSFGSSKRPHTVTHIILYKTCSKIYSSKRINWYDLLILNGLDLILIHLVRTRHAKLLTWSTLRRCELCVKRRLISINNNTTIVTLAV